MSNSWDEEKKRVLQNELGVAQDEVNASTLGRSVLGQSTRKVSINSLIGWTLAPETLKHG